MRLVRHLPAAPALSLFQYLKNSFGAFESYATLLRDSKDTVYYIDQTAIRNTIMKRALFVFLATVIGTIAIAVLPVDASSEQPGVGVQAPEFELPDQTGQLHSLEDYRDQWVVLYFYPKDETPGCTKEACEFRDNIFAFRDLNAQILGVSLDDVESHKAFAENHSLPFPLLADVDGDVSDAYGVKTRMFHDRRQTSDIYHRSGRQYR